MSPSWPWIVGIGASAGGLEALTTFFSAMAPDSGMAFVVVQHLSPDHPSLLPELLGTHTAMPVRPVIDGTSVVADHVYLIPPNSSLTIEGGVLHLAEPTEAHGHRMAIDHFFRSLATDQGERAIGIILSGGGTDGTLGLVAIKEGGGVTLAQAPDTTAYGSMPHSAIARGVIDYVLPVALMPTQLLEYVRHGASRLLPIDANEAPTNSAGDLPIICAILRQTTGHDFSHYKPPTLLRRIARRMQLLHLTSSADYIEVLRKDRREVELLFGDLLISVTQFFRDPAAFRALEQIAIPQIVRATDPTTPIRVWVPGCASGEEVYSVAMLLRERLGQLALPPPMQLFATDIDEHALDAARQGRYDEGIAAHLSAERLARFFVKAGDGYRISKAIREACLFSTHNLIRDPPFARMDLIVCRNLLIYFDSELQHKLIPLLHYALAPGGFLFLGSTESVAVHQDLFQTVDKQHRIFQRKEPFVRPHIDFPLALPDQRPVRRTSMARPIPAQGAADLRVMVERILLQDYSSSAVVIDQRGTIVYFFGNTGAYLTPPTGNPTLDILALAHHDLQLPLRTALHVARSNGTQTRRENIVVEVAGAIQGLTLIVRPLAELGPDSELLLVVFQELGAPVPMTHTPAAATAQRNDGSFVADQLAQELQATRNALEATIDELQEANSELMLANEALISLNEELQSANEELQSSKEESQSINEEIQTINAELSRKVEALDRVNADLANLFASTQIPAIFLQADGRITRFTPAATELFRLIETDIGRPIGDIVARFDAADLSELLAAVLATLEPYEMQVRQTKSDSWWIMRIRPYRTLTNSVDGVVVTFADISSLKRAEVEQERLLNAVQQAHDSLEQRVQERTGELAAANAALQNQINERIESERSRQQLLQQLVTAQEEERRRIARELHDQLGQDLTALILGLKALHDDSLGDPATSDRVRQLQEQAMQLGQEVRTLAVQLRPTALDDMGLLATLENYVEQWSARALVAVDFHHIGLDGTPLPLAVETTIYRLVQEALTNVLKHAQARSVSIIVERRAAEVSLIVEDDGVGFEVAEPHSGAGAQRRLGLVGMSERVAHLNGVLTVESAPGSGTTVFVRIPLADTM